jgi:hypothetical protein
MISEFDKLVKERAERRRLGLVDYYEYEGKLIIVTEDEDIYEYIDGVWIPSKITPEYMLEFVNNKFQESIFKSLFPNAFESIPDLSISEEEDERRDFLGRIEMVLYPLRIENHFLELIKTQGFSDKEIELIEETVSYIKEKHKGQYRKEYTPYYTHCLYAVLKYYELFESITIENILVLLLHDTIEDTDTTYSEINNIYGINIADSVMFLSKIRNGKIISMDKYFDNISKDRELIKYKAADRMANLSSLFFGSDIQFRDNYLHETENILLPIILKLNDPEVDIVYKRIIDSLKNEDLINIDSIKERIKDLKEGKYYKNKAHRK